MMPINGSLVTLCHTVRTESGFILTGRTDEQGLVKMYNKIGFKFTISLDV